MTGAPAGASFVLVVEDEPAIQTLVARTLRQHAFQARIALRRDEVLALAGDEACAAVLLDLGLPDDDGMDIARALRERSDVPILMLTGRAAVRERVSGLEAGADDYIVKPFDSEELVARLRAVLRRKPRAERRRARAVAILLGAGRLDLATREFAGPSGSEKLTEQETRLLRAMVDNDGPLARASAYGLVFGRKWEPTDRSLDVHVANLRRKLKAALGGSDPIATLRGKGYELSAPASVEVEAEAEDGG
jgi:two-component system phosphate regulon response regulator OmpR